MRHKPVMVVLAITLTVGMVLATQTVASAGRSSRGSSISATGTISCTGASGNVRLSPGWKTNSNTLPGPSKAVFNVSFNGCSDTTGNITTKVFSGRLTGIINFKTNDCSTNFGGPVTLYAGPRVPIYWNRDARVGRVIPAATNLAFVTVTLTFTAGVGVKFTFTHLSVTGSFSAKTVSGELDSSLDGCSPIVGVRNIPIAAGALSQP